MIRILIVDDHHLVRTGTCRLLADIDGFEIVG
ncbi:MAG TPA: DNA-binding response regulator, partial [Pseudomonadales bacterium]|nr:DNA-binding response regulator [Pseudomonadales bacterium]